MSEEPDPSGRHRALGVELNNRSWALLGESAIGRESPLELREEFLYGAYASAFHWIQAGTPINRARAEHLISRVSLRVGDAERALHHARRCRELVESHPELAEDWDLPFAHEALARALAALGRIDDARRHRDEARRLTRLVADERDRGVLEAELASGEWAGLA